MITRRAVLAGIALTAASSAFAADKKLGAVIMHGKTSDPSNGPQSELAGRLRASGILVRSPALPWSRGRYLDKSLEASMDEIEGEVTALRQGGAQAVILIGQSMGTCAAISYAALKGGIEGIVGISPGHSPAGFQRIPAIRESLGRAKAMVAAGRGSEVAGFDDSDQGSSFTVKTAAATYVSWFDPQGHAEMSRMAPLVKPGIPVMLVVGNQDRFSEYGRASVFDRLPSDARNQWAGVNATHKTAMDVGIAWYMPWIKQRAADA